MISIRGRGDGRNRARLAAPATTGSRNSSGPQSSEGPVSCTDGVRGVILQQQRPESPPKCITRMVTLHKHKQ